MRGVGLVWIALGVCGLAGCFGGKAARDPLVCDFDRDTVGSLATGWVAAETNGRGSPAIWRIVRDGFAPSPPHVMAVVHNENRGLTYNLMMARFGTYRDVAAAVYLRADGGRRDQGGGLCWRARDAANYLVACWNPLETNVRLFHVAKGRRHLLASAEAPADVLRWQHLAIRHVGRHVRVCFNDRPLIEVETDALPEAGAVGLWTKGDALTSFDALTVSAGQP